MASMELEESSIDYVKKVLDFPRVVDNLANDVADLKDRVTWLERSSHDDRPDRMRPDDIDLVVRIQAKWAPGDCNAEVIGDIAEISDGGDGTISINIGDTTIWLPRSKLSAALAVISRGRE